MVIITYPRQHELLNKRSELFCKCRHENKYLLKNFRANDKGYLNILTEGTTLTNIMILNPGKCYYLTFDSNTTKNEFVLEEGTILSSAKEHVVLGLLLKPGPGP